MPEHRMCPVCNHHTSQAIGGKCTVFVPGPPDGPLAVYCDCDCYKVLTGKSLMEKIAESFWGKTEAP